MLYVIDAPMLSVKVVKVCVKLCPVLLLMPLWIWLFVVFNDYSRISLIYENSCLLSMFMLSLLCLELWLLWMLLMVKKVFLLLLLVLLLVLCWACVLNMITISLILRQNLANNEKSCIYLFYAPLFLSDEDNLDTNVNN